MVSTHVKLLPELCDVLLLEGPSLHLRLHDELDLAQVVVQQLRGKISVVKLSKKPLNFTVSNYLALFF